MCDRTNECIKTGRPTMEKKFNKWKTGILWCIQTIPHSFKYIIKYEFHKCMRAWRPITMLIDKQHRAQNVVNIIINNWVRRGVEHIHKYVTWAYTKRQWKCWCGCCVSLFAIPNEYMHSLRSIENHSVESEKWLMDNCCYLHYTIDHLLNVFVQCQCQHKQPFLFVLSIAENKSGWV